MNPAILVLILRVLLALLLYAFLAILMVFLWRDIRSRGLNGETVPDAHLLVQKGPEPGKVFPMTSHNVLGRSAENDVSLPHDTVSTQHASITFRNGHWWLEDLGSRNGTLLNDARVDQSLVISSGDKISLGGIRLVFNTGPPSVD
jgi:hypothetical protein